MTELLTLDKHKLLKKTASCWQQTIYEDLTAKTTKANNRISEKNEKSKLSD